MTVGDTFKQLGDLLSAIEANKIEVVAVTADEVAAGESLAVELRLDIPTDGGESGVLFERAAGARDGDRAGTADQEGTATADSGREPAATAAPSGTADEEPATTSSDSEPAASPASGAAETDGVTADQDSHACDRPDCDARFESADALTVHRFVDHDQPDEPLHRHEPALEAAYRAYDSFPKMADALSVDVTPQTVRRNMIDGGIHGPDSAGTGSRSPGKQKAGDDGGESVDGTGTPGDEQATTDGDRAVTDGLGAAAAPADSTAGGSEDGLSAGTDPGASTGETADDNEHGDVTDAPSETVVEGVTVDALREGVVEGGSLRAAAERLDRGRGETRKLLSELGLLELVHGRVATRPERAERSEVFEAWLADRIEEPSEV